MRIVETDKWLLDSHEEPLTICKKLKNVFPDVDAEEIYHHLSSYGMYTSPLPGGEKLIMKLQEKDIWRTIQEEYKKLQREWNGPKIPIFIFPSDPNNRRLKREHNGKSGLAFKDKLFLFVSEENEDIELRALFTHEYNHVCRLSKLEKREEDFTLLDTIILEGLAENAVKERFGEENTSNWTSYYSQNQLEKLWNDRISLQKDIEKTDSRYYTILYGRRFYPKMAGYCVGYHLVNSYATLKKKSTIDMLHLPANEFIPF